jgi:hypothetical protein
MEVSGQLHAPAALLPGKEFKWGNIKTTKKNIEAALDCGVRSKVREN